MTTVYRSELAHKVIGCAIEVHKQLGPGLMESSYAPCLAWELASAGLRFQTEVAIPLVYKEVRLDCGYRADFIVEGELLLEIKSVEQLLPVHSAQVMTYLKLTRVPQAVLLNFNVVRLKQGLRSFLYRDGVASWGPEDPACAAGV